MITLINTLSHNMARSTKPYTHTRMAIIPVMVTQPSSCITTYFAGSIQWLWSLTNPNCFTTNFHIILPLIIFEPLTVKLKPCLISSSIITSITLLLQQPLSIHLVILILMVFTPFFAVPFSSLFHLFWVIFPPYSHIHCQVLTNDGNVVL